VPRRDRDTEGVEGGKAWEGSVPSPSRLRGVGILRQRGLGRSPGRKRVLVHLELETAHLMETNFVFFWQRIFSHIHILLNIKLHCICPCHTVKTIVKFFTPICVQ